VDDSDKPYPTRERAAAFHQPASARALDDALRSETVRCACDADRLLFQGQDLQNVLAEEQERQQDCVSDGDFANQYGTTPLARHIESAP
jgi:hypothetical protein